MTNNCFNRDEKKELRSELQTTNNDIRRSVRSNKRNVFDDLATGAEQAAGSWRPFYEVTKTPSNKKPSQTEPLKDKKTGKTLTR